MKHAVRDGGLARLGPDPSPDPALVGRRDDDALPDLREQLDAYWRGELHTFDLALTAPGTPFQQQVWTALRTIPFGQTCSYGQLAEAIGAPTASRAVGAANGRNPVFLVVPCHRVVGSTGKLVGYAGGLEMKRALLDHERACLWSS
jgi:methylated-DNA-[protein]-cysteine S-methyltransferase